MRTRSAKLSSAKKKAAGAASYSAEDKTANVGSANVGSSFFRAYCGNYSIGDSCKILGNGGNFKFPGDGGNGGNSINVYIIIISRIKS